MLLLCQIQKVNKDFYVFQLFHYQKLFLGSFSKVAFLEHFRLMREQIVSVVQFVTYEAHTLKKQNDESQDKTKISFNSFVYN